MGFFSKFFGGESGAAAPEAQAEAQNMAQAEEYAERAMAPFKGKVEEAKYAEVKAELKRAALTNLKADTPEEAMNQVLGKIVNERLGNQAPAAEVGQSMPGEAEAPAELRQLAEALMAQPENPAAMRRLVQEVINNTVEEGATMPADKVQAITDNVVNSLKTNPTLKSFVGAGDADRLVIEIQKQVAPAVSESEQMAA